MIPEVVLQSRQSSSSRATFLCCDDPAIYQPWCPDVRLALSHIHRAFAVEGAPTVVLTAVGEKPECVP